MSPLPKKDYYRLLDLPPDATPKQIRDAYRQRVTACHPDKFLDPAQKLRAEESVKQLNQAYETLRQPDLRAAYDRRRIPRPSRPAPRPSSPPAPTSFHTPRSATPYPHPWGAGTPSVAPLDAAYPAFPSHTSPAADHLHYVFTAHQGDRLQVFLERRANLILLDELNYFRYRAQSEFRYLGGYARYSPVELDIPFSARWHLVLDTAGAPGVLRATVRLITAAW